MNRSSKPFHGRPTSRKCRRSLPLRLLAVGFCLLLMTAGTACRRGLSDDGPASDGAVQLHPLPVDASTSATAADARLFERLDAASLGMDFRHEWKPRDRHEATLLKTAFTGGGVALGDYDADGLCDVVLSRPHGGPRLYHNEGGFRFRDVTESAGLVSTDRWTTGVTWVDADNDGLLDLAVCSYDGANQLFLNRGQGRFADAAAALGLDFRGASVKMAFADYDADGDLDAYLVTNRLEPRSEVAVRYLGSPGHYTVAPEFEELVGVINLPGGEQKFAKAGQADRLYRNQLRETGELRFEEVGRTAGLTGFDHGLDVTWWDYNRDLLPDLYVANDFTDPDRFYHNNGDGTFREITGAALPNTPWFAMGSAAGDVNNDGRFDLIATDMAGTTHYRQKMAMGSMEAVAWFLDTAEPRQYMRNSVFLNSGTGRFLEVAHLVGLSSSDWTWSVKLADLDLDGREDVYVTNGFTRDYLNSDFNLRLREKGAEQNSLAWYDAPELREANLAFRNEGDLRFRNVAQSWGLDEVGISFGAAMGDLDGDGDQDLVVNNFSAAPSVYRNRAEGARVRLELRGTRSNRGGVGAILEATTEQGIQARAVHPGNGFMSSNETALTLGLGNARRIESLVVQWPSGAVQRLSAIDAGQRVVIVEPDQPASRPTALPAQSLSPTAGTFYVEDRRLEAMQHRERNFDDFAREPLLPNKMSQLGPGMAWADVDGDGDLDAYLGGAAGQSGQLLLQDQGAFAAHAADAFAGHAECEDMGCLFLDAEGDGDLDLLVVSGGVEAEVEAAAYQDRLYLQEGREADGRPQFVHAESRLPRERDSGGPVAAADFDRDGDLDLFVGGRCVPGAYPTTPVSHLWRNDGGTFVEAAKDQAPGLSDAGMVTSGLWTDVNGDGWIDLLVATEYGPVRLFRNENGQLREATDAAGLASHTGWWNSLAAADVDRDGDLDYLATNRGNNTKYHPAPDHPQMVYYGDFDGTGKRQIIEAKQTDAGMLPVRGRSCSSNAMPFLAEKFATYDAFAKATLPDIYSEDRLSGSLRVVATTPYTSLLVNDGQGRFQVKPLPALAQVAPGMGVEFLWCNHDTVPDLFLAQNFYQPERETGRMNGGVGLVLLGDAMGDYRPLWPDESGVVLPDDCRAMTTVDLDQDGWQDLVVATNDGPVRTRLHAPTNSGSVPRPLRLHGRPGNPAAIGASVEATSRSGRRVRYETRAGGGYLAQAPIQVYLMEDPSDMFVSLRVTWPSGAQEEVNIVGHAGQAIEASE